MRRLMWAAAAALAVAILTLGVTTLDTATAQEAPKKENNKQERQVVYARQATAGSYLGVRIEDIDDEDAERLGLADVHGVLVSEVLEETPAAEAGLQEDDVLVSWNGTRLEGVAQLQRHMRETPVGRNVRLGVFRDGRTRDFTVTLGEREGMAEAFVVPEGVHAFRVAPEDRERMREQMDELRERMRELRVHVGPQGEALREYAITVRGRGRLGVSIQSLSDQLAEYFGVENGALITSVLEDSPAQRAGLRAGDVIVGIAGKDVEGPADVMRALRDREAGPVDLSIVRDRKARTISVELEERRAGSGCAGAECEEWHVYWEDLSDQLGEWAERFGDEWAAHAESFEEWAKELQKVQWTLPHVEVVPLRIGRGVVIGV